MNVYFEHGLRYYRIRLLQDLFGDWVVERIYGSKATKLGQKRSCVFDNEQAALDYCQKIIKHRINARHYTVISGQNYLTGII